MNTNENCELLNYILLKLNDHYCRRSKGRGLSGGGGGCVDDCKKEDDDDYLTTEDKKNCDKFESISIQLYDISSLLLGNDKKDEKIKAICSQV